MSPRISPIPRTLLTCTAAASLAFLLIAPIMASAKASGSSAPADDSPPNDSTDTPLASLSLTHVHYDPSDPISLISAYASLLPLFLLTAIGTIFFATRELESFLFLAGQLGNELLNSILKHTLRQPRPTGLRSGYGMPSSHSQFVAFFAAYLILIMGARGVGGGRSLAGWGTWLYGLAALGGSGVVAGSRVYLGYHSVGQVAVGYGVGVVVAVAWWAVGEWEAGREMVVELFDWFWLRDSARGRDLVEAGYWAAKEGWKVGKGQ